MFTKHNIAYRFASEVHTPLRGFDFSSFRLSQSWCAALCIMKLDTAGIQTYP